MPCIFPSRDTPLPIGLRRPNLESTLHLFSKEFPRYFHFLFCIGILANRLVLRSLPQISDNQQGILPDLSIGTAIKALIDYIEEKGAPTYTVFTDFRAAFDNVRRERLIATITTYFGVQGKLLRILSAILEPNRLIVDHGADSSNSVY